MTVSPDLSAIDTVSEFSENILKILAELRPKRIIETGTFIGTGTTTIIASGIREIGIDDVVFYSIEVNPVNHETALGNLKRNGLIGLVRLVNGLSVPRHLLPTFVEIEETCVKNIEFPNIYVDHHKHERAQRYYNETNWGDVPDDQLGRCLKEFEYRPDFVLLDSGGHMGNIEFNYLTRRLEGECVIGLDDIYHVKHHRSFLQMQDDSRFEMVVSSRERAGFCIARFDPLQMDSTSRAKEKVAVGKEVFAQGEVVEAIRYFEEALSVDPHNGDALNNLGIIAFQLNDLQTAERFFEQALDLDAGNVDTRSNLSAIYRTTGQLKKMEALSARTMEIETA